LGGGLLGGGLANNDEVVHDGEAPPEDEELDALLDEELLDDELRLDKEL